jgi:hypothetical protein
MRTKFERIVTFAAVLTVGAIGLMGQPPVTIKGYTLGQTINEIVQGTPTEEHKLKACRGTAIPTSARSLETELEYLHYEWCHQLIAAIDHGTRFDTMFIDSDTLSEFASDSRSPNVLTFDGKKLVKIKMAIMEHDYADVLADVKARLGEPTEVKDVVSQNSYGAIFHHPLAVWIQPTVVASLRDNSTLRFPDETRLVVQTATEADRAAAKKKTNRVDPLN